MERRLLQDLLPAIVAPEALPIGRGRNTAPGNTHPTSGNCPRQAGTVQAGPPSPRTESRAPKMSRTSRWQSMTARSRIIVCTGLARLINPGILQLRVTPETASALSESAKSIIAARPAEIELEIVVPSTDDPEISLARVAADCKSASLAVARVLALPESYLRSYQPAGPWPAGPTPQDLWKHARASFPAAGIGGGVLTYFTELNRCRPQIPVRLHRAWLDCNHPCRGRRFGHREP